MTVFWELGVKGEAGRGWLRAGRSGGGCTRGNQESREGIRSPDWLCSERKGCGAVLREANSLWQRSGPVSRPQM